MILMATQDKLRIVTGSTADVDIQASWLERSGINQSYGRSNLTVNAAATTDIISASELAGVARIIREMTVRNRHASASNDITIIHTDGTNAMQKAKAILLAGETLVYSQSGWDLLDNGGRRKQAQFANAGSPISTSQGIVVLSGDVTNNNAIANTMQDVTGLSFPVVGGKTYWFEFFIFFTAAATSTGSRWSINGPAFTGLNYESRYSLTTTTETRNALLQAYDLPAASNATSAATGNNWAKIEGMITPSADGTVIARFASEVSSSAIVAKAGSFVKYHQVN